MCALVRSAIASTCCSLDGYAVAGLHIDFAHGWQGGCLLVGVLLNLCIASRFTTLQAPRFGGHAGGSGNNGRTAVGQREVTQDSVATGGLAFTAGTPGDFIGFDAQWVFALDDFTRCISGISHVGMGGRSTIHLERCALTAAIVFPIRVE